MSFFDKLKVQAGMVAETASSAAQTAAKQTKTLAAVGRVKLAIVAEEDKMKKAYTELGRLFYRDYETEAEADMIEYQPWCDRVADSKVQIARLNDELVRLRSEENVVDEPSEAQEAKVEEETTVMDAAEAELFADVPVAEETVPEEATVEEVPVEETPVEETAASEPEPEKTPTVGTLYVDITGIEE